MDSPQQKGPAVRQLDMRHLQLGPLATQDGEILAPVELESLSRAERQRNEGAAARRLLLALAIRAPVTGKGCHPAIGAGEAERHEISMQLLQRSPLLARFPGLGLQPAGQLVGERIKLARPFRRGERRLDRSRLQVLLHRIARQPSPSGNLADRKSMPQPKLPDDVQKSHVDHSVAPPSLAAWGKGHMGQFSMEIMRQPGSLLGGNQHAMTIPSFHAGAAGTPRRPAGTRTRASRVAGAAG